MESKEYTIIISCAALIVTGVPYIYHLLRYWFFDREYEDFKSYKLGRLRETTRDLVTSGETLGFIFAVFYIGRLLYFLIYGN